MVEVVAEHRSVCLQKTLGPESMLLQASHLLVWITSVVASYLAMSFA